MPLFQIWYTVYGSAHAEIEADSLEEAEQIADGMDDSHFRREEVEWTLDREYNEDMARERGLPINESEIPPPDEGRPPDLDYW
jgi:hypothetical protein